MVIKKFKGRDYVRGRALLVALTLLFMRLLTVQGPPPPYEPALPEEKEEKVVLRQSFLYLLVH
jgi:hypothetical protein